MRRRKAVGFNGLDPISWSDIAAFNEYAFRLVPWEVEIIERLDDVWMAGPPKTEETQQQFAVPKAMAGKPASKLQSRPMTGKLFDAIFGGGAKPNGRHRKAGS